MYAYTCGSCSGSPHSSHSVTVSGSDGSRMVFSASTNGTCATIPANASGAMFAAAPISRPPAEAPRATSLSGAVHARRQVARAGDEVGEGVLLAQQLPAGVPGPAHLAAAAHVRDGVPEAPVQQRQHRDGEAGVPGYLVGAVAVQQERRAAVPRRAGAAD